MKSKGVCIPYVSKVSVNRSRELILGQILTPIRIRYYLGGHFADHHHQVVRADIPGCYWTFLFLVSSPELATVLISIIFTLYRLIFRVLFTFLCGYPRLNYFRGHSGWPFLLTPYCRDSPCHSWVDIPSLDETIVPLYSLQDSLTEQRGNCSWR